MLPFRAPESNAVALAIVTESFGGAHQTGSFFVAPRIDGEALFSATLSKIGFKQKWCPM